MAFGTVKVLRQLREQWDPIVFMVVMCVIFLELFLVGLADTLIIRNTPLKTIQGDVSVQHLI